jgi:AraC family transcriptional regulator
MFAGAGVRIRDYDAFSVMEAHEHHSATLSILTNGDFSECIGLGERAYARGHAVLSPAGLTHSQAFGAAGARQVIISPKREWLEHLAECRLALQDVPYFSSVQFARAGDRLIRELSVADDHSRFACEALVLEIIAAFGRGWCRQAAHSPPPKWLTAAKEFIHAHALGPLSVEMVARDSGRHPVHLCREFRRHFGISVAGYARYIRIEEAKRLIEAGQLGLSEIAIDCGFSSHAHLCREFKAQLGVTPSEFRSSAGGGRTSLSS